MSVFLKNMSFSGSLSLSHTQSHSLNESLSKSAREYVSHLVNEPLGC